MVMPSRNSLKEYKEEGIYHIYNRGIDKRVIFKDKKDYSYFLYLLKSYLSDPEVLKEERTLQGQSLQKSRRSGKNFFGRIELICYCLMPNHFHLLVKQSGETDITEFMKCLMTSYSMYFNLKYKRQGTLFQGRYKAALVETDEYLLHLSRYIHLNPLQGQSLHKLVEYDFSSYADYLDKRNTNWIKKGLILDYFVSSESNDIRSHQSYRLFVEDKKQDSHLILGSLILEDEIARTVLVKMAE